MTKILDSRIWRGAIGACQPRLLARNLNNNKNLLKSIKSNIIVINNMIPIHVVAGSRVARLCRGKARENLSHRKSDRI